MPFIFNRCQRIHSTFLISCLVEQLHNYITIFAKMLFFKISVILCFSVDFLFSFLSPANFSRPSRTKFGTNVSSCLRFKHTRAIFEKFKNQVTTAKKLWSFFRPGRHVFARCDETVKVFLKIFSAFTTRARVLYLSGNVIVKIQNRPVFSNTWLNGESKRPTLTAIIAKTARVTAKISMAC